jgi:hypothetical protein
MVTEKRGKGQGISGKSISLAIPSVVYQHAGLCTIFYREARRFCLTILIFYISVFLWKLGLAGRAQRKH